MGICPTSSKVRVSIFFGDGSTKNIETPGNTSIAVVNTPANTTKGCYCWSAYRSSIPLDPAYPPVSNTVPYYLAMYGCARDPGWKLDGTAAGSVWWGAFKPTLTYMSAEPADNGVAIRGTAPVVVPIDLAGFAPISNFPLNTAMPVGVNGAIYGDCNACKIPNGQCQITITSSGGIVIYQSTGKCPITYETNCDDDCHDGCCKVITQSYPGYCCAKSP